jgi:hypothetical protein
MLLISSFQILIVHPLPPCSLFSNVLSVYFSGQLVKFRHFRRQGRLAPGLKYLLVEMKKQLALAPLFLVSFIQRYPLLK